MCYRMQCIAIHVCRQSIQKLFPITDTIVGAARVDIVISFALNRCGDASDAEMLIESAAVSIAQNEIEFSPNAIGNSIVPVAAGPSSPNERSRIFLVISSSNSIWKMRKHKNPSWSRWKSGKPKRLLCCAAPPINKTWKNQQKGSVKIDQRMDIAITSMQAAVVAADAHSLHATVRREKSMDQSNHMCRIARLTVFGRSQFNVISRTHQLFGGKRKI